METVKEVIIVEGRYDKKAVGRAVNGLIVETAGFGVFSDSEKLALIRRLSDKNGAVILTDSDGAGFVIRNYLKGVLQGVNIKHAYIPDIRGKEKRKSAPSKEGKLGVEGMETEVIREALKRCGVLLTQEGEQENRQLITKADLYAAGLSGLAGSRERRRLLLERLKLPGLLSPNAMLDVLNALYTREEFLAVIS